MATRSTILRMLLSFVFLLVILRLCTSGVALTFVESYFRPKKIFVHSGPLTSVSEDLSERTDLMSRILKKVGMLHKLRTEVADPELLLERLDIPHVTSGEQPPYLLRNSSAHSKDFTDAVESAVTRTVNVDKDGNIILPSQTTSAKKKWKWSPTINKGSATKSEPFRTVNSSTKNPNVIEKKIRTLYEVCATPLAKLENSRVYSSLSWTTADWRKFLEKDERSETNLFATLPPRPRYCWRRTMPLDLESTDRNPSNSTTGFNDSRPFLFLDSDAFDGISFDRILPYLKEHSNSSLLLQSLWMSFNQLKSQEKSLFNLRMVPPPLLGSPVRGKPSSFSSAEEWMFTQYRPSVYESRWRTALPSLDANRLSKITASVFKTYLEQYIHDLRFCTPHIGSDARKLNCAANGKQLDYRKPKDFSNTVFSSMGYRLQRSSSQSNNVVHERQVFIEPLAGVLRSPTFLKEYARKGKWKAIGQRDYMIVDPWHMSRNLQENNQTTSSVHRFLFDVGAGTWDEHESSQQWFHDVFLAQCILFDEFFMWEIRANRTQALHEILHAQQVRTAPSLSRYHFFDFPASADRGSWHNPLNLLLSLTTPEDIVVFKLDIDTPLIEEEIVRTILEEPEVSRRIDHFFFEHHVAGLEMMSGAPWGGGLRPDCMHANDSIAMFAALRRRGIAAHSWV